MITSSSTRSVIDRRLPGLIAGVFAIMTAFAWMPTAAAGDTIAVDNKPIVVADAYHGVGFEVCRDGSAPLKVADAYHGIGVIVCPGGEIGPDSGRTTP
jgi:hypothetical protein